MSYLLFFLSSLADRACGGLFRMPRIISLLVSGITGGVCAYFAGAEGEALLSMYLAYAFLGRKFFGLGAFQGNALRRAAGQPHSDTRPTDPETWYPMFIPNIERQYSLLALMWGYLAISGMAFVGMYFDVAVWPLLFAPLGAVVALKAGQLHRKYLSWGDAWATIEVVRGFMMPLFVWGATYVSQHT